MFKYIDLSAQLDNPQAGPVNPPPSFKASEFDGSQLPGARIMQEFWKKIARPHDTETQLFQALFSLFTEKSRAFGWDWAPGTSAKGYVFIDGMKAAAECRAFAGGLFYLAVAPKPFGLGMKLNQGGQNGVWLVNHCPDKGFISVHPDGGVCNLSADILINPNAAVEPALHNCSLKYWANHKVVLYNGLFYDPAYGTIYEAENDMESLHVEETQVLAGVADFKTLEQNDLRGACILKCKSATDRVYYFRRTPQTLLASERIYQGPISKQQRDWLETQLKSNLDKDPIKAQQLFSA